MIDPKKVVEITKGFTTDEILDELARRVRAAMGKGEITEQEAAEQITEIEKMRADWKAANDR